jgi:hypothetical protein
MKKFNNWPKTQWFRAKVVLQLPTKYHSILAALTQIILCSQMLPFNKLFWMKTILWRKTSNCQEHLICQGENFKRNKSLNKHVSKLSRYSGYTIIEVVNWKGSTSGWNSFLINWLIDFLGMNLQDFVPRKKGVRQNKMKKKLWRRT